MKKSDAIDLLKPTGSETGSNEATGGVLGISRQAVHMWPEELPLSISDRVRGAAVRIGKKIPKKLRDA